MTQVQNDKWCIYMHKNLLNHKVYIGLTKCANPNNRWRNGAHYEGTYFGRAIQKYGWDNFEHVILEQDILTLEEANEKERFYIAYFESNNRDKGYNSTSGGDSFTLTPEARQKRSEILQKRWTDNTYREHMSNQMRLYW